MFRNNQK